MSFYWMSFVWSCYFNSNIIQFPISLVIYAVYCLRYPHLFSCSLMAYPLTGWAFFSTPLQYPPSWPIQTSPFSFYAAHRSSLCECTWNGPEERLAKNKPNYSFLLSLAYCCDVGTLIESLLHHYFYSGRLTNCIP